MIRPWLAYPPKSTFRTPYAPYDTLQQSANTKRAISTVRTLDRSPSSTLHRCLVRSISQTTICSPFDDLPNVYTPVRLSIPSYALRLAGRTLDNTQHAYEYVRLPLQQSTPLRHVLATLAMLPPSSILGLDRSDIYILLAPDTTPSLYGHLALWPIF
jgi:hypothetical protein